MKGEPEIFAENKVSVDPLTIIPKEILRKKVIQMTGQSHLNKWNKN
jgi:hypothetical protein